MLAMIASSIITRTSAKRAFDKYRLGLTTPKILKALPKVIAE